MATSNRIKWLCEEVGLQYRTLAEFFRVSVPLIHMVGNHKRDLPRQKRALLDDPLFAPYNIGEEIAKLPPPAWDDSDKKHRVIMMNYRDKKLQWLIIATTKALEKLKDKHRKHHTVLYHTRHLPDQSGKEVGRVENWWILLKNTALFELMEPMFSLSNRRKLELKLALLKTELQEIERWKREDELEVS
jgi:hypothetical protein